MASRVVSDGHHWLEDPAEEEAGGSVSTRGGARAGDRQEGAECREPTTVAPLPRP